MTSTEAERSFSCLRRIYTWLRQTMSSERLRNLAVCHVNRNRVPVVPVIKDKFKRSKDRKLEFKGSKFDLLFHFFCTILYGFPTFKKWLFSTNSSDLYKYMLPKIHYSGLKELYTSDQPWLKR